MEKCYSCEEIAKRYSVKLVTVWKWIRTKKLTAIKTGGKYSIRPEDLEKFEKENITNN